MQKLNAQLPSANRNDTNDISAARTKPETEAMPKTEAMPVSNLTEEEMDFPQETNAAPYNPLGGHPKGTTNEAYVNLARCIALAKNEAAEEYLKVREDAKKKNKKAPWGSLGKILEKAKQKHELPSNIVISIETVWTRAKHGSCKV